MAIIVPVLASRSVAFTVHATGASVARTTASDTTRLLYNDQGELMIEAYTTMMGQQGENSTELKWDRESGQVVRTAARG